MTAAAVTPAERHGWRLPTGVVAALATGCCGAWAYGRAGASWTDVLRDLTVGWSYAAAGLVAWWRRPGNGTGPLMLAEGLTWFLGNLQGTAVPGLFAVGAWTEALNLAVLAHLLLAYPEGRLTTVTDRRVVSAGYLLVGVGGLIRTLLYDPAAVGTASYLNCRTCGPNALLLHSDPGLFAAVDLGYRWLGVVLTLLCVTRLVSRWRGGGPARRRALIPAWIAVAVAVAFIGWEMLYVLAPGALGPAATALALPSDLSQIAVPFAFLAGLLRMRLRRAAIADLVTEAAAGPVCGTCRRPWPARSATRRRNWGCGPKEEAPRVPEAPGTRTRRAGGTASRSSTPSHPPTSTPTVVRCSRRPSAKRTERHPGG
ncbi:hypothetical protein GCM10023238_23110 [Streptomyces heliomycini]